MKQLIVLLIIAVYLNSCSSKINSHSASSGKYQFLVIKTGTNADPVITGNIFAYNSNSPSPAAGAIRIAEKVLSKTDSNGHFLFSVSPGEYKFTALSITYATYETKLIKLDKGDSVKIDFFLKDDNRPLH